MIDEVILLLCVEKSYLVTEKKDIKHRSRGVARDQGPCTYSDASY